MQQWLLVAQEHDLPGVLPLLKRTRIDLLDYIDDGLVQLGQTHEPPITQHRSDLIGDEPHAALHDRLVTRSLDPGRNDRGAVMLGQAGIGRVQHRFIPVGP